MVIAGPEGKRCRASGGEFLSRLVTVLISERTQLIEKAGRRGKLALEIREDALAVERNWPAGAMRSVVPESLVEHMPQLPEPSPHESVTLGQSCRDAQPSLSFTLIAETELSRAPDIGEVAFHQVQPLHLPGTDPVGVGLLEKPVIPISVCAAQRLSLTFLAQLRPPEVPNHPQ